MARKLVALAGAAATLLLVAGAFTAADAQVVPGARGHSGGVRAYGGSPRVYGGSPRVYGGSPRITGPSYGYAPRYDGGRRHAGRFHGRRLLYGGVPLAYGAYYYGYRNDGCGYLLRRAEATGDPYWWDRYNACINGYYDYDNYTY
jgi:hypothetical protein